jgi:hypothetical protein
MKNGLSVRGGSPTIFHIAIDPAATDGGYMTVVHFRNGAMIRQFTRGTMAFPMKPPIWVLIEDYLRRLKKERESMDPETVETIGDTIRHPMTVQKFGRAYTAARLREVDPSEISIVLDAPDFDLVLETPGHTRARLYGFEVLRGNPRPVGFPRSIGVFMSCDRMIESDRYALAREIFACLHGRSVRELPECASSDTMAPGAYRSQEIAVPGRAAIGDHRDRDRPADVAKQIDVVAAKAAIAEYARNKQLPSPEMLAAFRELDRAATLKRAANADLRVKITNAVREAVKGHRDGLSSEALGRAADQIGIAEGGRPHRDFIGAAAQSFAEVLDAGDAPAHRKRRHDNRA